MFNVKRIKANKENLKRKEVLLVYKEGAPIKMKKKK